MSVSLISHLHATFCDYDSFTFRDCDSKTELSESFCIILLFFYSYMKGESSSLMERRCYEDFRFVIQIWDFYNMQTNSKLQSDISRL